MNLPQPNGFEGEPSQIWSIRLSRRADEEIEAARQYFERTAGEEIAEEWLAGLRREIAKLAQFPARMAAAPESNLFQETVRDFLYRRTARGPAYRVFFVLMETPQDAPIVRITHIRHAARAGMTRKEARQIEAAE